MLILRSSRPQSHLRSQASCTQHQDMPSTRRAGLTPTLIRWERFREKTHRTCPFPAHCRREALSLSFRTARPQAVGITSLTDDSRRVNALISGSRKKTSICCGRLSRPTDLQDPPGRPAIGEPVSTEANCELGATLWGPSRRARWYSGNLGRPGTWGDPERPRHGTALERGGIGAPSDGSPGGRPYVPAVLCPLLTSPGPAWRQKSRGGWRPDRHGQDSPKLRRRHHPAGAIGTRRPVGRSFLLESPFGSVIMNASATSR